MEIPIPQPWLDAAAAWSPYVLAVIAIATVLVPILQPIARRLEDKAKLTRALWDDKAAHWFAGFLDAIAFVLQVLTSVFPRLTMGMQKPTSALPRERRTVVRRGPTTRPPDAGAGLAIALVIAAAALSAATSGCGATAFEVQVEVAAGFESSSRETAQLVRAYRTDSMRAAAREVHDAGGSAEEAIAAARARGEELAPLVEGQRLYALATHAYVDALWIAEHRREGWSPELVLPALRDLVDAYRHLRRLGAQLDVPALAALPETPSWLDGTLPPQLLARADAGAQEGAGR